jgi:general L-amino acid transport system permease protein
MNERTMNLLPAFLRDVRVLRVFAQIIFIVVIVTLIGWLLTNAQTGLQRANIPTDFNFLSQPSGFQIDEGLTFQPHKRTDPYVNAFVVGFVNTLRATFTSLILSTVFGLFIGIGRLSTNWLVRTLATGYIEVFQNTPLLLQLFFLFALIRLLPPIRQAIELPGPAYLSVRGLAIPTLNATATTLIWFVVAAAGIVGGAILWRRLRRIRIDTGRTTFAAEIGGLVMVGVGLIAGVILNPFEVSTPRIQGLGYAPNQGGIITPEFLVLVLGLVLYTSAFIAEVVRSGIQAVPSGQWEASRAGGLTYGQTLRLVILPQALRIMIPPLTNQYLNLAKNSSLGAAVGYAELFGVARTMTQSVPAVPVIAIVMFTYLALSLVMAWVMNWINGRVQIKTR